MLPWRPGGAGHRSCRQVFIYWIRYTCILQGYTIQGASLDFSINATVAVPSAAGSVTTDVVTLGPSSPVGLSAKVGLGFYKGKYHCLPIKWLVSKLQ